MKQYDFAHCEAIAISILLSHGCVYRVSGKDLFFQIQKGDELIYLYPHTIAYIPGWKTSWQLWFTDGTGAFATEREDIEKVVNYILDKARWPKEADNLENLLDHNDIRRRNLSFISKHGDLTDDDFAMIDAFRAKFAEVRKDADIFGPIPHTGDIIEGAYYEGKYPFKNGVIESHRQAGSGKRSVCAHPSTFVNMGAHDVYTSISGGPFFTFDVTDFELIGEDTNEFWTWGHAGRCADGGIHFTAKVKRWRIKEGVDY